MKHRLASQHYWQSTQGLRKALLILCFSGAPFFPVVEHINATVYVTTTVDQQKKEVKGTKEEEAAMEKSYKHLCALRDEVLAKGVLPPISEWHALNPNIK